MYLGLFIIFEMQDFLGKEDKIFLKVPFFYPPMSTLHNQIRLLIFFTLFTNFTLIIITITTTILLFSSLPLPAPSPHTRHSRPPFYTSTFLHANVAN